MAILAFAISVHAATVYDTFGVDDAYDPDSPALIDATQSLATPFILTGSAHTLASIELALLGKNDPYTVSLTEGGATNPGTILESWSVSTTGGIVTLTSMGGIALTGRDYYVVVSSNDRGAWSYNAVGNAGPFSFTSGEGWTSANGTTPVMRITADPVPEPAGLAALGLGTLTVLRRRTKR